MKKNKLYTKTITLPNGKRKYVRAATKEELERKFNQLKAEIGAGIDVSDNSTVTELAQLWYTLYKKPYLRDGGRVAVLNAVNNHILPYIGTMRVRDVKPVHVRQIMTAHANSSKSLQTKVLQTLRSIFLAAEENGMIAKSPVPRSLKAGGDDPEEKTPLTVEQCQALLVATRGTRAYTAVLLMLSAGLRREEACGLMWSDIDFERGELTVNRAKTFYTHAGEISTQLKSDSAHRTIPLPAPVVDELRAAKAKSNSLYVLAKLDGSSVSNTSFRSLWGVIEARTTNDPSLLGQPIDVRHPNIRFGLDFHVHPHLLRHTCITRWFDEGLDIKTVQYLAGHATPDITLRVYDHYVASLRQQETAQRIKESTVLQSVYA